MTEGQTAQHDPQDAHVALRADVIVALMVGVSAIGFAAIFFKQAAPTHPLVSSAVRLTVASLVLSPLVVRAWRRGRLDRRQGLWAVAAGGMYAVHFGAWVTSLMLTSVAASVTLVTATPLLLALAGLVTGRDVPQRRVWAALGLSLVGLALIGGHDSGAAGALWGDALALLGAAAMAVYLWIGRRLGDALDVWAFSGIATGVGALVLWCGAIAAGVPLTPASERAWVYLVLAALVPQLIGHTLLTWSLRHTSPTLVGMSTLGEPVVSTALAWVWLGEAVAPQVGLGCLVTLAAVGVALSRRRQDPAGS